MKTATAILLLSPVFAFLTEYQPGSEISAVPTPGVSYLFGPCDLTNYNTKDDWRTHGSEKDVSFEKLLKSLVQDLQAIISSWEENDIETRVKAQAHLDHVSVLQQVYYEGER